MPELPEVETVVRDLRPLLAGRTIERVRVGRRQLRQRWSRSWNSLLTGSIIHAIRRRGKWILVDLRPRGLLVLHLGMTGQLGVHSRTSLVSDHTHLILELGDGGELRFRDIRRFGSATWHATETEWERSRREALGPEPFDLGSADWSRTLS